jgi:nitrous oxide reductase accessory protein NosL
MSCSAISLSEGKTEMKKPTSSWRLHTEINTMSLLQLCIWLTVTSAVVFGASDAKAQLAVFRTEMDAQLHCPNDEVVWLDFKKNRYYVQSQRLYGQGRTASFVCRKEARKSRYGRSLMGRR